MTKSIYVKLSPLALFFFMLVSTTNVQAQDKADTIIGIWEMNDQSAKMEVFRSGDEYQAKLLWGKDITNPDGTSKTDNNNPDAKLKNRDLIGMTYITGLSYDDEEWENGHVYNNANGKWYKCYVWIKKDRLHLRGYLGLPMLGQTTKWNRVK
ncbi:DUF2147 domain-containing protein [Tamlana sp. 2201CG12-4]|uniref:DUF2147 domain-containing protein n=1 Tax=Tamlana sp. 2201CG12-4 TaxID=3112582 RepID=UPI002DBA61C7|nr:DUF2147 domain-containing protein [Tamlana sp. 2201CG12-4]MEC3908116.1 DUF2147 domain-containing protein [Tamlana sp. 2201CG12-4]